MNEHYDLLIKHVNIVDGTGKPMFTGDIGIKGEKIAEIGDCRGNGTVTLDGRGLTACPGFFDSHSHADLSILNYPDADNLIMQGITTFIGGHCGISLAPLKELSYFRDLKKTWGLDFEPDWRSFGEWLVAVEQKGISPNYIPLVGHNAIRGAVLGDRYKRGADKAEIAEMEKHVREAMEQGVFGMSLGLDANSPGHFAGRDELVPLLKIVNEYGGVFSPHTRHHQNQWPSDSENENAYGLYQGPKGELFTGRYHGLLEAVELAQLADNIRLLIAHLTPAYSIPQPHPEALDDALASATLAEVIDAANDKGIETYFNVIPSEYSIGSQVPIAASFFNTNLSLPEWLSSLEKEEFIHSLKEKRFAEKVRKFVFSGKFKFGMINPVTDPYWFDCYRVLGCKEPGMTGKTIGEIIRSRSQGDIAKMVYRDSIDLVFELLKDDMDATWALIKDKRESGVLSVFLRHPRAIPMTDVHALPAHPVNSRGIFGYGISPAAYAMFPNFLAEFVKNKKTLSLEEAVKKITSQPARNVFRITDRGVLKAGQFADIVIMDFESVQEQSSFLDPGKQPEGIHYVTVNGSIVYDHGKHTSVKAGKVLMKKQE